MEGLSTLARLYMAAGLIRKPPHEVEARATGGLIACAGWEYAASPSGLWIEADAGKEDEETWGRSGDLSVETGEADGLNWLASEIRKCLDPDP